MTTKDWVYLGLILLTALAFYCNGFYAGVYRCKRMYDSLLDDSDATNCDVGVKFISTEEKVLATADSDEHSFREPKVALSSRELKGNFGKN
jgi:hypothetical protein